MECQCRLYQIETCVSLLISGRGSIRSWVPSCISAPLGSPSPSQTLALSENQIVAGDFGSKSSTRTSHFGRRFSSNFEQSTIAILEEHLSYHSSIGMPPFEMFYGRRCRTPIYWGEVGQRVLGSTEVVQRTTEDIQRIRERLRTTQSRQKSYADKRRSDLEFQVGDRMLLKVSPWKGVIRFRKRGKLGPRYIRPFTILARVGKVAYRLELPAVLGQIHNTFHVSQLRKCLADETAHIPLDDIQVDESLNYVERPIVVLDRKVRRLRNKEIGIVKVQWQHRKGSEWTWEPKVEMRELYPELFSD
ncbi:hypothetical protein OSB04_017423 [Centaurea solstitialis]|uniref:Tf2-1-like SH3-like domain-containing protein n=1 Tax=Centaurea solstitialis TaxID=347529 RepID=A0AA38T2V6_9ASTR|nr:hypothetical protein OSB04_017423 [Centaurea solstitialis]